MDDEAKENYYKWKKARFTKKLRRSMTRAESVLWEALRNRKCNNLKFRRQVNIGPYIVDFLCKEYSVIVEVDGSIHSEEFQKEHDIGRDEYLTYKGYRVLRFTNANVMNDLDNVLSKICECVLEMQNEFPLLRKGEG